MKKTILFGMGALGLILLSVGGYETVKTVSSIQYYDIIKSVKRKWGLEDVPDDLTLATIETESSFDPDAVRTEHLLSGTPDSGTYADASVGLMQILYSTAQGLGYTGDIWGLQDPETNIRWGTTYQLQLFRKYNDWDAVIHAYNEGPGHYDSGKRVPTYYARVKARMVKWAGLLAAEGNISA